MTGKHKNGRDMLKRNVPAVFLCAKAWSILTVTYESIDKIFDRIYDLI